MYGNFNVVHNYIHGELERPENIIFGYGDELDKDYQGILDRNDNELLKNVKVGEVSGNETLPRYAGVPDVSSIPSADYGALLRKF